jgi:myo-inositol-hexaphosphate 3-phosphohydrolase
MSTGIVTGNNVGTANITYSRAAGCISVTVVTVNGCARPGMTEGTDGDNSVFTVSPNPTTGAINLTTDIAGKVVIYTIDGKQLQQYEAIAGTTAITLPWGLASGVYLLRFNGADGSSKMVRLVYQQ